MNRFLTLLAIAAVFIVSSATQAHDGRRFQIQSHNGQLFARGYISGTNPSDDGGGIVRPYFNAVHSHWSNIPSGTPLLSQADLPGFDLEDQHSLQNANLQLTVVGLQKWANFDPHMTPTLTAGASNESWNINFGSNTINTANTGQSLELDPSVGHHEHYDLTYDYIVDSNGAVAPNDTIYVLQVMLTTDAVGILDSHPVNIILSPPTGMTSHHASLNLEQFLGTPVPEPATLALAAMTAGAMLLRRRR